MYKLSNLAADDFGSIYEYTWREFGALQADKYTRQLEKFLQLLAKSPMSGRDYSAVLENTRRHDHGQHAIFYRPTEYGIFIIRILHQQMNVEQHLI